MAITESYVETRDRLQSRISVLNDERAVLKAAIEENQSASVVDRIEAGRARRRLKPWWPFGLEERRTALEAAIDTLNGRACAKAEAESRLEELIEELVGLQEEVAYYNRLVLGEISEEGFDAQELLRKVQEISRFATSHNYGSTVETARVVRFGVVEVLMSSWPRAQEARRALEAAGYSTSDGPNKFGQWIRVALR